MAIIFAPRFTKARNEVSMRGWFVPGLCPMQMTKSHFSKSSSNTVPLPTPILAAKPTLVGSWHMLEQSGKLLLPYSRAKS
ncbi:Uncharacterised protein [Shigella sonnei]|nr:Uncharacterised protein [Shigella sonnei]CSQ80200.1 Uncharacterised protein [Shigella sonnei]CSS62758.1 Uncharacterised protein [Shigella sonnei]